MESPFNRIGGQAAGSNRAGKARRPRPARQAAKALNVGSDLAKSITPELYNGTGLGRENFADYNNYLQPGVDEATSRRQDMTGAYDELLSLRKNRLGGLNSAENTALREQAYGELDQQKKAALDANMRTSAASGQGSAANFAQNRIIGRDSGLASAKLEQGILLDNVGVKERALADYESTQAARLSGLSAADANLNNLRGNQASTLAGVNQTNRDQFEKEIAGRAAAQATGVGIFKDQQDRLDAKKRFEEAMKFSKEQDAARLAALKGL